MLAPLVAATHRSLLRKQLSGPHLDLTIRTIRPSLLDQRFCGDPWIVDRGEGPYAVCLGNYPLAWIERLAFDLPALNRQLLALRYRRASKRPRRRDSARDASS